MSTIENDLLKRRHITTKSMKKEYTYPEIKAIYFPDKVDLSNPIIINSQNKQAFDTLYEVLQEIGTITQRAIREGDRGHKPALHKIMEICRSVE